jgi:regulator of protease activity HflC (stomatin/prohibitin superfamily)
MGFIKETFDYLSKLLQWWIIVLPWEKAILIRWGKHLKVLGAGIHFRIPFIDTVYLQSTRLRVVQMPPQTITTKDKHTLTIVMCAGYSIDNIETLYQKMFQAESTIANMVMGEISEHISSNLLTECTPSDIEGKVMTKLNSTDYGIKYEYVKVIGYAIVKTYRLIQDHHWTPDSLSTNEKHK